MHRQQFKSSDAELLKVLQHGGRSEAGIGSTLCFGNVGMRLRGAFNVNLINHRIGQWNSRRGIVAPIEGSGVGDAGCQEGAGGSIAGAGVGLGKLPVVGQFARIGVEQQVLGGKAVAGNCRARFPFLRPIDAITVAQAGACAGQITVPDLVGFPGQRQAVFLPAVKQT